MEQRGDGGDRHLNPGSAAGQRSQLSWQRLAVPTATITLRAQISLS